MTLWLKHGWILMVLTSCSQAPIFPGSSTPDPTPAPKKVEASKVDDRPVLPDDVGAFDGERVQLKTDRTLWKLIDDRAGIQTYEKITSNNGLVAFRGEILIPAPLKKIATILIQDEYQKDWVDSFVSTRRLSEKSVFEHVKYNQTKVPWPFQNRDFVFNVHAKVSLNPATMLILMKSTNDPGAPLVEGVVRGEIIHSYYYLKELNGLRATRMVVEMEVDPKGAIPLWLVNLSQKNWPFNTLMSLKKISLREDIPVMEKLETYFEPKKGKKK